MSGFNYTPGPTGAAFMRSRDFIKIICGPVGGGKSTVALMELVRRAGSQKPSPAGVRRTRFIILRNTLQQLKSTVKPLIDFWLIELTGGRVGAWKLTDNIFHMKFKMADGTTVDSEFWMMPADTPDDVRRLLSVECSAAWVEEAREINPQVFSALQGRTNRFPNRAMGGVSEPGVIASTNPPPMGSWWQEVMETPPKGFGVFMQPAALLDDGSINPAAENLEHLAPDYYDNLIAGKSEDWIEVYLKNRFGLGGAGQPVYKGRFKREFHVANENLKSVSTSINPLIIGLDNGLTAAAVLLQMDARGQVRVLDECYVPEGTTMGVDRFLETMLVPKLRNEWPVPTNRVKFVLDPACFQRSQIDARTIASEVQSRGFEILRAETNDIERRIGAVEALLSRQIDGGPAMIISPKCQYLIRGYEQGYKYKMSAAGVLTPTPDKASHYSHIHDANQYACLHYNAQISGVYNIGAAQQIEAIAYPY